MFVKRRTRRVDGRTYHSYALVETVRTDRGPRHRTICGLGDLPAGVDLRMLSTQLDAAATGQQTILGDLDAAVVAEVQAAIATDHSGAAVEVDTSRVTAEAIRELGPVFVGHTLWCRLGLPGILADAGMPARAQVLTEAMVLNRLINPGSEHAMPAWFARTAAGDLLGEAVNEASDDSLYRMLDRLHVRRETIERSLALQERTLFNLSDSILLYDLTSTYFEGLAEANPKAQRGYSRDGRPDCKQVVIGLVLDGEGFPRAHEVFAGNTADSSSVEGMLNALERRIGRRAGATVVVDRGMSGAANLALIRGRGYHFIVACRQGERDGVYDDLTSEPGWTKVLREPSPTNPAQRKTAVRVKRIQGDGCTYLGVHSTERIDKDRAIREKHEARLLADLERLRVRIAAGKLVDPDAIHERIGSIRQRHTRVARYYDIGLDVQKQLCVVLDQQRRDHAVALDGTYLMKTDRTDLPDDEIWRTYMLLTRVEHAFRDLKTPLGERPIFHQVEHRVEAHIFLCVLAYHLLVAIEYALRQQHDHRSWATVRDQLRSHHLLTIVLPTTSGTTLRIRRPSTPEPVHREIYNLLDLDPDALPIRRSWDSL
jgi:transposase